jgi:hypothetical protein
MKNYKLLLVLLLFFGLFFGCVYQTTGLSDNNSLDSNETTAHILDSIFLPEKPPIHQKQNDSNFKSIDFNDGTQFNKIKNDICEKIQSNNPQVRNQAVSIASMSSGAWNTGQLVDLYLWMKNNIACVSGSQKAQYVASASETLAVKGGNCEDHAILVASIIQSIGGEARIMLAPECKHAYTIVFMTPSEEDFIKIQKSIVDIYWNKRIYDLSGKGIFFHKDNQGYWLIIDTVGGNYLGDTYPDCIDSNSVYRIDCPTTSSSNN